MGEHLKFMKSLIGLKYTEVDQMKRSQKKLGLVEKGLRIIRLEHEQMLIGGHKVRAHRLFVKTSDSGDYANVGWILDRGVNGCMMCAKPFGVFTFRHHCRSCGNVVCSSCSPYRHDVVELKDQGKL